MKKFSHISVLKKEAHEYLNLRQGVLCVDGTLGGCGHALEIFKTIYPLGGRLIGIDQDIDAVENAEIIFSTFCKENIKQENNKNIDIIHGNFSELPEILLRLGIERVDAVLLDLGLSFHQLMESERGFSFQKDELLDMRMDIRQEATAQDIVNDYSESGLADIFFKYGEEKMSKRVAKNIVKKRAVSKITSTKELSEIIIESMPVKLIKTQKINPCTRVFQALRIEVNKELQHLERFMNFIPDILNIGGRVCIISFHSLEDRIVKHSIRSWEKGCTCPKELPKCRCGFVPKLKAVVRKPIVPSSDEIKQNPLSRSAKLRVAERI